MLKELNSNWKLLYNTTLLKMLSTKCNVPRLMNCQYRSLSVGTTLASHYDALEIPTKATQAEIKTAYYRLSKLYHPDLNDDVEASKKFRLITEAYEILGNIKTKRLYDRGYLGKHHYDMDIDRSSDVNRKSKVPKHRGPSTGKTAHFDFDEWSSAHYGKSFRAAQSRKKGFNEQVAAMKRVEHSMQIEKVIVVMSAIILGFLFIATSSPYDDYDNTQKKNK